MNSSTKVNRIFTRTVTIASGQSLGNAIDLEGAEVFALHMPAAWTTANLTLQAAATSGGTYQDVYDDLGSEVVITAVAARAIAVDANALKLAGLQFIKLRSGTTGTPVAQGADRTITVVCKH